MNPNSSPPSLLISTSADPDTTWPPIYLTEDVTCLGRPPSDQRGSNFIDLELITDNEWVSREHAQIIREGAKWVSREHAQIIRQGAKYVLKNWKGKWNIRMYEKEIKPGDSFTLHHGAVFQLPDVEEHFKIMFVVNDESTVRPPLYIYHNERKVWVFNQKVRFTRTEYTILLHLYRNTGAICSRSEIISTIWPGSQHWSEAQQQAIKQSLQVHLAKIRAKLREASGGFTFMQTIRQEGLRLVVGHPTPRRRFSRDA